MAAPDDSRTATKEAVWGRRMESDVVYFGRRAREERQAASKAPHQGVRDRHLELAQAYELRTRILRAGPEQLEAANQPFMCST